MYDIVGVIKMNLCSVGLVLLSLPSVALGANILGVFSITSISHQIVYRNLMLELNKRGHNITLLTPNPLGDPNLTNYREIDVSFYYDKWNRDMIANPHQLRIALHIPEFIMYSFVEVSMDMCRAYLSSPQVRSFIREGPQFDLLITEFGFNPCFYGFAKFSGYRHMGMFSFQANPIVHSNIGNPTDASYISDVNFPYMGRMNFWQRVRTIIFEAFMWGIYGWIMSVQTGIAREHFGSDLPHLVELERNVSVMMVNTHFTMGFPRPNVPNMVEIGGPAFHLIGKELKPLPQWLPLLALLTWTRSLAHGANILAILPTPSYSHQQFYRVYLQALHDRGHNLTVATPNPLNDPTLANYREIDLSYLYGEFKKILDVSSDSGKIFRGMAELLFVVYAKIIHHTCLMVLSDRNLMDIYRKNETFDVFVVEWGLLTCVLPFESLAHGGMIGISSFELGAVSHSPLGSVWNPAFVPDPSLEYSHRMTFLQRVRSAVYYVTSHLFTKLLRFHETNLAREHFGPDVENMMEIERKVALIFDNSHVTTSYPRPNNVNIVSLGGPAFHLQGRKAQPLPKELKDFLDDAPNGVIYFSLGTNVRTDQISKDVEAILAESFRRVKPKVLWRWENDKANVHSKNVKMGKWFPQVEVLAHPNVKAFVTQAGLQSVGEAIEYQVPMIVMPFFADQNHNARRMELEGVAINLDFDALTVDSFTRALNEIVYNKNYKDNMVRFSALVKDQPVPPLEKAVWWTEYVIRHKGAPHLRSAAATMPWYQYFMLDVLAVVFLVLFLIVYVLYVTLRLLLRGLLKLKKD